MPADSQLKPASSRAVIAAIYVIAFALLAWAVIDTYQRYEAYKTLQFQGEVSDAPTTIASKPRQPMNTRQVARHYLFGKQISEAQPVQITRAPATRLNLELIGVIAANEDGVSKAIIQIDGAEVGVYSAGDKLPKGNATIDRIEATQVLLNRNGKLESLAIERPELPETEE